MVRDAALGFARATSALNRALYTAAVGQIRLSAGESRIVTDFEIRAAVAAQVLLATEIDPHTFTAVDNPLGCTIVGDRGRATLQIGLVLAEDGVGAAIAALILGAGFPGKWAASAAHFPGNPTAVDEVDDAARYVTLGAVLSVGATLAALVFETGRARALAVTAGVGAQLTTGIDTGDLAAGAIVARAKLSDGLACTGTGVVFMADIGRGALGAADLTKVTAGVLDFEQAADDVVRRAELGVASTDTVQHDVAPGVGGSVCIARARVRVLCIVGEDVPGVGIAQGRVAPRDSILLGPVDQA